MAVADAALWTGACHFHKSGSLNDDNVLKSSPTVNRVLQGSLLPHFEYVKNNHTWKDLYFVVDGIYPRWSIFVSTIHVKGTRKKRLFPKAQEDMRKDVERALGVLISRWALLAKPYSMWDREFAGKVMNASIILHTMIVESKGDGHESQLRKLLSEAVEKRFFINENGAEICFVWQDHTRVIEGTYKFFSDTCWAQNLAKINERI